MIEVFMVFHYSRFENVIQRRVWLCGGYQVYPYILYDCLMLIH